MLTKQAQTNNFSKPADIERELKKYIFGQDEYIKKLSLIAVRHMDNQKLKEKGLETINNNTLIIGPSGCGKTFAVKKLAELLDIPFIMIDGSTLQSNNYRGQAHVRNIFNNDHGFSGIDIERSIVFIDEFDKTLDVYALQTTGSHMVQRDMLKLLENNKNFLASYGDGSDNNYTVDTSSITFICAGSYAEAYDSYVGNNDKVSKMGFGYNSDNGKSLSKKELTAKDLIKIGNLPELIGRFSSIVNINPLSHEDIFSIFKNGQDSTIKRQQACLALTNTTLDVTDDFYRFISSNVQNDNTGFRGAEKIINKVFDVILYDVKNSNSISNVCVDYKDDSLILSYTYPNKKKHTKKINSSDLFGSLLGQGYLKNVSKHEYHVYN